MFKMNTEIGYALLLLKSITVKSFEAMGPLIKKSGNTVSRLLRPAEKIFNNLEEIAVKFFANKKKLYLVLDDTLIKKIHSQLMLGSGFFYDTKIGRKIRAYKLLCSAITDGKYIIPLRCCFLFDKDLVTEPIKTKDELIKPIINRIFRLFPNKNITVVLDGAFATKKILAWAKKEGIALEVRMHSNRKVEYKGQSICVRDIIVLKPKGRQEARTISVVWHGIELELSAQLRTNKHGVKTIVYQASTIKAKPIEHVKIYKKRWPIEKLFRTCKQHLGLEECFSRNMDTQLNHIASTFLAYAFAQLEMKKQKLECPEDAIRALKLKNMNYLNQRFSRLDQIFELGHA